MTTCQSSIHCLNERPAVGAGFLSRIRDLSSVWAERHRQRAELGELLDKPEFLLRDMGIAREEIFRESRKPFWRK